MELMAQTDKERKIAERKRLKKAGYVALSGKAIWVPKDAKDEALQFLQDLRDRHEKKGTK